MPSLGHQLLISVLSSFIEAAEIATQGAGQRACSGHTFYQECFSLRDQEALGKRRELMGEKRNREGSSAGVHKNKQRSCPVCSQLDKEGEMEAWA